MIRRGFLFAVALLLLTGSLVAQDCTLAAGANTNLNEGPTDYAWNLRPAGAINAVMIFVDFPDAPQNESTTDLYNLLVPPAQRWLAEAAYGRVSINVTAIHKWYRMPRPASEYNFARGLTFQQHRAYVADALAAADAEVDFRQFAVVYIVAPRNSSITYSPTFVVRAGSGVVVDGVEVRHAVTFGTDIHVQRPDYGAMILVHETGHLFGLPDLYAFQAGSFLDTFRFAGAWDPMSSLSQRTHMVGWHKYKMGWVDAAQVNCLPSGEVVETLTPVDTPGGRKAVVFLTGRSTAYVVEARRARGQDAGLCDSGVLVYTVDATIATGSGPLRVRAAQSGSDPLMLNRCGLLYDATLDLRPGKPSRFEDAAAGFSVEVLSASETEYRVRARREPLAVPPAVNAGGVVNGASFAASRPVAAGSIAAVFGTNLATATTSATTLPLPAALSGTSARLDGFDAPLFFVSPFQINLQVPWQLAGRTQAMLTITSNGVSSTPVAVPLAGAAPGVFTMTQNGSGQAAALIAGTAVLAAPAGTAPGARPARRGEFISVFTTGLGPVSNQPANGAAAPVEPLSQAALPLVTIGGASATVTFSGLAPGFVGLYQLNIQVPDGASSGAAVPIVVALGAAPSVPATIAVE